MLYSCDGVQGTIAWCFPTGESAAVFHLSYLWTHFWFHNQQLSQDFFWFGGLVLTSAWIHHHQDQQKCRTPSSSIICANWRVAKFSCITGYGSLNQFDPVHKPGHNDLSLSTWTHVAAGRGVKLGHLTTQMYGHGLVSWGSSPTKC